MGVFRDFTNAVASELEGDKCAKSNVVFAAYAIPLLIGNPLAS